MKYSEYNSKPKFRGGAAFYIIIACCLLGIGGAAWFAAANLSGMKEQNTSGNGLNSIITPSSRPNLTQSNPLTSATDVAESAESVPYSSPSSVASKPSPKPKEEALVFSMPVEGNIIKKYSDTELQFSSTFSDMRMHYGIDIACEDGTKVSAAGTGKVLSVEQSTFLGTVIVIDHGNGITTKYASIKNPKVKAGDKVASGDIIGAVTFVPGECADQSHLHLEVQKNGHSADPLKTLGLK